MTLTQELHQLRQKIRSKLPDDVKATMDEASAALAESQIVDRSLNVGDRSPDFALPNARGQNVTLSKLLESGAVVLSFYRGQWCPYCNLELRHLQQALPEIQKYGAQLVAVSPQTPDNSLSTIEKNELTFEVLSDVGNAVAREFGLA
ncbi:MAG: AhpC/TSA family protein [Cyanobacteria bacterium SID2]|nr:AhpC/TSA family protein [Cyanobacteria bacterium SID2]MBP0004156.1 AhpC/TSA family protein [Cyanobacteria bacterium SBC]